MTEHFYIIDWLRYGFKCHPTQNRSFWKRSSQ